MSKELQKALNSLEKLYDMSLKDRNKLFLLDHGQEIEDSYYTLNKFIQKYRSISDKTVINWKINKVNKSPYYDALQYLYEHANNVMIANM